MFDNKIENSSILFYFLNGSISSVRIFQFCFQSSGSFCKKQKKQKIYKENIYVYIYIFLNKKWLFKNFWKLFH